MGRGAFVITNHGLEPHGASPVYILAGLAVHEQDAYHLQQRFAAPLSKLPGRADPRDYELHATELAMLTDHMGIDI